MKPTSPKRFLFNVDLLIESESNAKAVEQLLHILGHGSIADFRIQSGLQFGRLIEQTTQQSAGANVHVPENLRTKASINRTPTVKTSQPAAPAESVVSESAEAVHRIRSYIQANRLIRLNVNKGRGVKLSVPCRILNYDETKMMLTVYHVDEKQVYTFRLNEIDDFIE